jgi:ATP-dependent Lhr-like helicase
VRVAAVDPLNVVGILTPGPRVPAIRRNAIVYHDGVPAPPGGAPHPHSALGLGSR